MAVLRSPMAHARIVSVDVSAALEMPGVIAAYSGADLADVMGDSMPCAWPVTPDMSRRRTPRWPRRGALRR
jgi:carbon-monoxide dehydrogenase large subunit